MPAKPGARLRDLQKIIEQYIAAEVTDTTDMYAVFRERRHWTFAPYGYADYVGQERIDLLDRAYSHLSQQFAPDALGREAAHLYLVKPSGFAQRVVTFAMQAVLCRCILASPPTEIVKWLAARLRLAWVDSHTYQVNFRPDEEACSALLIHLPPRDDILTLAEQVAMYPDWRHGGSARLLQKLWENQRLDYAAFKRLVRADKTRSHWHVAFNYPPRGLTPEFSAVLAEYDSQLAHEMASNPTQENLDWLGRHDLVSGIGSPIMLVDAARIHAEQIRKPMSDKWRTHQNNPAMSPCLRLTYSASDKRLSEVDRAEWVHRLREFPPKTLRALVPFAVNSRSLLVEALDWQNALPLIELILETAGLEGRTQIYHWGDLQRNSDDPEIGVIDLRAAEQALSAAGEKLAKDVLELYRKSGKAEASLHLLEAAAGWNEKWVLDRLPKRNQVALKAYGLLPLKNGADDCLERYLFFKQFARESSTFGPMRQANERAAVAAALANLAQRGGYADSDRLEWAMERRIGDKAPAPGHVWRVADYEARLQLSDDGVPSVAYQRGGKSIKTPPQAVKRDAAYGEIKEAVQTLKRQGARLKDILQDAMSDGDWIEPGALGDLAYLPMGRRALGQLIGQREDGVLGLIDPQSLTLEPAESKPVLIDRPIRIAHVYHIHQAGQLSLWQRTIVKRRIVQPFKQAFRELYLLTPAELDTRTYSNRFAGHLIQVPTATRLFQSRGWKIDNTTGGLPHKILRDAGLIAYFSFADSHYWLGQVTEPQLSDRIYFAPYQRGREVWSADEGEWLPLDQIPPLTFSEVMRDADLIVSVAQSSEDAVLSSEAYQKRAETVTALLEDLDFPGVSIDGHFARVEGKLARYRIHLGSGAIHIEPGNYLCIIPERSAAHETIYLPFAANDDRRLSEIISKILLLANDHKIRDQSILAQIKRA